MIRLALKTADGRPMAVKFGTDDRPMPLSTVGSVLLLTSAQDAPSPLPGGGRVLSSQFAPGLRASFHRDNRGLERLADRVAGWEGVHCDGEPVECTRSLLIELLRSRLVRQQVMQALQTYDHSGILV